MMMKIAGVLILKQGQLYASNSSDTPPQKNVKAGDKCL